MQYLFFFTVKGILWSLLQTSVALQSFGSQLKPVSYVLPFTVTRTVTKMGVGGMLGSSLFLPTPGMFTPNI